MARIENHKYSIEEAFRECFSTKNTREPARSGKKKPQPRTVGVLLLVEAATITSRYESICCVAKRQKCPHRYPQMTSPGFLARFRQILTLFRRSPCAESLQRIGAADQGARPSKSPYCVLPLLVR